MPLELKIIRHDDGSLAVTGPIDDKIVAYGLLECARDAITEHHLQKARLVQPATVMPFPKLGQS